ncbi:MarC family protein [Psychromonas sp. MME1]|uniref:MarC family protein n=2 Tax=unclassified Psychromonas TaxID=2614957 RepID=UPI0034E2028B
MDQFFTLYLKLFFMMTPFFVMSVFLTMSKNLNKIEKKNVVFKSSVAVIITGLIFLLFGKYIFSMFGITLEAFKIGAGTVLFLSALDMIRGNDGDDVASNNTKRGSDFAIVPLAIPSTIGPGMIGVLMVIGAELQGIYDILVVVVALLAAVFSLAGVLLVSNRLQDLMGKQGLEILPKITGLFVSAIGAQIVFSGIKGFLF